MKTLGLTLALAGFAFCSLTSSAQAQASAPSPIPIEEWSLDKVSRLGVEIFEQDRAAWLASDVLIAGVPVDALSNGRGWIVVPNAGDRKVRFITQREDGTYRARWDVVVGPEGAGPLLSLGEGDDGVGLIPEEAAQFQARQTAIENIGRLRCSERLNTVVVEDPDSDGWLVWLLTSTTDANIIPFGGHYRFRISKDGKTVVRRDMLSNSCLAMPRAQPGGEAPVALSVTQIVSSGPVETHVFLSIQNRLPIFVMTPGKRVYEVAGAEIRDATSKLAP